MCDVSPWELTGQIGIHNDGGEIDVDEISGQRDFDREGEVTLAVLVTVTGSLRAGYTRWARCVGEVRGQRVHARAKRRVSARSQTPVSTQPTEVSVAGNITGDGGKGQQRADRFEKNADVNAETTHHAASRSLGT